jgi:hypothetical protein
MEITQPEDGLHGLRPVEAHSPIGIMPNEAHQDALGFIEANEFKLAIVEFDDQGRCFDRLQLDKVSDAIEHMRETSKDAIVLVFVHGWKHDARTDDDNLASFRRVLGRTARHERDCADGAGARDVFGVFVGWRGVSVHGFGDLLANATFWGRQEAAHRVATGSVRELFGRLRHYRNSRLKHGGCPLLMISGHSFGGMIVFSALAQSLIEAASAPAAQIIPGFADLVLLANPAIEGARYLPIYDLVTGSTFKDRTSEQLPVFVCVQAQNDQAVGTWFPVGNFIHRLDEACIGALEKKCITHAMGFIDEFRTHRISGPAGADPFILDPPLMTQKNPFWIVSASEEVVNEHGGIWQDPFMSFLSAILFQHVKQSKSPGSGSAAPPQGPSPSPSSAGDVADFARSISP